MTDDPKTLPPTFFKENAPLIWIGGAIAAAVLVMAVSAERDGMADPNSVASSIAATAVENDNGLTAQVTSDVLRMAENTKLAFFTWGEACQSPQLFTATDILVNGKSCNGNMCDVDVSFKLIPTADFFPWHEANPRCTHETMGHEQNSFAGGIAGRTGVTSYQPGPVDNLTPGGGITFHQMFTYQQFDTGWRFQSKRHW